jgi:hypothetical protein
MSKRRLLKPPVKPIRIEPALMLKPSNALLESDARFCGLVFHSAETGELRPMCIDDLRSMVASIELTEHVPPAIREQFDVARNAFVYSWFVYEFATLAEQQCFAILEMALRHRLDPAAPNTTRSPGLDKLLRAAVKRGWLRRGDFLVPSITGSGDGMCTLDLIPVFRNHLCTETFNFCRKVRLRSCGFAPTL